MTDEEAIRISKKYTEEHILLNKLNKICVAHTIIIVNFAKKKVKFLTNKN